MYTSPKGEGNKAILKKGQCQEILTSFPIKLSPWDQGCGAVAFGAAPAPGAGLNFHGSDSYFTVWGLSVISDFAWHIIFSAGIIFSCFKKLFLIHSTVF